MVFVINPYDRCVTNKIINVHRCTICWYMDKNKLSHIDENVVTDVMSKIKENFGDLKVTRGNKQKFIGMNINIRDEKKIEMNMTNQIEEAIEVIGEEVDGTVTTPAER